MVKLVSCATAFALALLSPGVSLTSAGSINDIEHVVIFMQENRAFDHYYGVLKGVRGFNDRAHPPLPSGRPVWYQPIDPKNSSEYMLPWHVDSERTSASCMEAPTMDFPTDVAMWNDGQMDAWNTARDPGMGMSYFNREDLPYYYTLADGFTIGDQYFQSTFTQTTPNRLFLFSGCNGLSMNHSAILNNDEPAEGWPWVTVGEILESANVSWKLYQEKDNFDDNGFAWFTTFKQSKPGQPLYDKGIQIVDDLESAFAKDMDENKLAQVSWIVAPTALSEHATNHPAAGEDLTARLLLQVQNRPHIYKKMAFILNYDEGGQFFDHHWTPTAPVSPAFGVSSVDVTDEIVGNPSDHLFPIGMGFRVPLIIVSPWTRGGHVVSQVFDHTSVNQFLEKRFNVHIPTISKWRRLVAGDLTSAFDFETEPDYSWPNLPSTNGYVNESDYECQALPKPKVPVTQSLPEQEPGTKPSRMLPYHFHVSASINTTHFTLVINNMGKQGGSFQLYNLQKLSEIPKKYAVATQQSITHSILLDVNVNTYNYSIHGPNGFVRQFSGQSANVKKEMCRVTSVENQHTGILTFEFVNEHSDENDVCEFIVRDVTYRTGGPWRYGIEGNKNKVNGGNSNFHHVHVSHTGGWYDVSVSANAIKKDLLSLIDMNASQAREKHSEYYRRFMGRIEYSGMVLTSDPAMSGGVASVGLFEFKHPQSHPENKHVLLFNSKAVLKTRNNKDAVRCFKPHFDMCLLDEEVFTRENY